MDKEFQNKLNKKISFLEDKGRNDLPKRTIEVLTEHKPKLRNWKGNNKDFSDYHDSKRFLLVRYDLWTPRPLNLPKGNVEAKSRNTWVDIHKSRQDVSNCDEGAT